jgi:hypothetical protein
MAPKKNIKITLERETREIATYGNGHNITEMKFKFADKEISKDEVDKYVKDFRIRMEKHGLKGRIMPVAHYVSETLVTWGLV